MCPKSVTLAVPELESEMAWLVLCPENMWQKGKQCHTCGLPAANVKRAAPRVPRPPGEESQRTKASSSSVMETTVTAPRRGLSCKTASTMRTSTHAKNMMPPQTVKRRHLLLYASIRSTSITRTKIKVKLTSCQGIHMKSNLHSITEAHLP